MTDRRVNDDGTSVLAADISATATAIPVGDAQWTTNADDYPLLLVIGGEQVLAAAVTGTVTHTFTGCVRAINRVPKAHAAGAVVQVAKPWRLSMSHAVTPRPNPFVGAPPDPPPPDPETGEPTIPTFNSGSATIITAGQNVKTIIEAASPGDHFLLAAGTHTNCENVLLQTNQHVRLAAGCILEGTGKGYCFRPADQSVTGVAIGGDPSGIRPIIRNYGNGTTSQGYGAIMGRTDDILGAEFIYRDVDGWFIYSIDFEENSSNAIKLGSNWTVYDVEAHGHTVTGFNGDRIVGGLIWGCESYFNALNPATGVGANGAQIKLTWCNGDPGRTSITPVDRAKAPIRIAYCTFEALDRGPGPGDTNIGVWCDLDCQDVEIDHNTFSDHPTTSVFAEGCNGIEIHHNTVDNSDGYGAALNDNFINGGIATGESTNCHVHDNTLINCDRALVQRLSNRSSDWLDPAGGANYGYSLGPRYWLLNTETIPAADGQSNIWTGNNTYADNILISCNRVLINEGTDNATQTTHGKTPIDTIAFTGNDYSGSPGIQFYDRSTTALTLGQWQALGRQ